MHKIIVSQDTSTQIVGDDKEYILIFVRYICNYANVLLKNRGYVYLNQIYEMLGVEWDVSQENTYFTDNGYGEIKFDILCKSGKGFELGIYYK